MESPPPKSKNTFRLTIGVVGIPKSGKSQVVNALLGGAYTEVHRKVPTASINYFDVIPVVSPASVPSSPKVVGAVPEGQTEEQPPTTEPPPTDIDDQPKSPSTTNTGRGSEAWFTTPKKAAPTLASAAAAVTPSSILSCVRRFLFSEPESVEAKVETALSDDADGDQTQSPPACKRLKRTDASTETESDPGGNENEGTVEQHLSQYPTAESILAEIRSDNRAELDGREDGDKIMEKHFTVAVDHSIVDNLEDGLQIRLVEIPGTRCREAINQILPSLDVMIIVMDGNIPVAMEDEQRKFLRYIKDQVPQTGEIPIVIAVNKVDDPQNKQQSELASELRGLVENTFEVLDRRQALTNIMGQLDAMPGWALEDGSKEKDEEDAATKDPYPIFLSMSAESAFLIRTVAKMSREEIGKKVGELSRFSSWIGKRQEWSKMIPEEQAEKIVGLVSDHERAMEVLLESNFGRLRHALNFTLGSKDKQFEMIFKQMQAYLSTLPREVFQEDVTIVSQLEQKQKQLSALAVQFGISLELDCYVEPFTACFWSYCDSVKRQAKADEAILELGNYSKLVQELHAYTLFLLEVGWLKNEAQRIKKKAKTLVQSFFKMVVDDSHRLSTSLKEKTLPSNDDAKWSAYDYYCILDLISYIEHDKLIDFRIKKEVTEARNVIKEQIVKHKYAVPIYKCSECSDTLDYEWFCNSCKLHFRPTDSGCPFGCREGFLQGAHFELSAQKCKTCSNTSKELEGIKTRRILDCQFCKKSLGQNRFCLLCEATWVPPVFFNGKCLTVNCTVAPPKSKKKERCSHCESLWREYPCSDTDEFMHMFLGTKEVEDDEGEMQVVPVDYEIYDMFAHINQDVPVMDPKHLGHLVWRYSELVKLIDGAVEAK